MLCNFLSLYAAISSEQDTVNKMGCLPRLKLEKLVCALLITLMEPKALL